MSLSPDQLDPDWHKYPDTVLHFSSTPVVRVDLREPMGADALAALGELGLAGPFAVLTAHDPRGRDEDAAENDARAARLDERLTSMGARFLHVDACSPDGGHCEASVAAVISREAATEVASEFEQVAIFWFDGTAFWIVGVLVDADPVMLPRPV